MEGSLHIRRVATYRNIDHEYPHILLGVTVPQRAWTDS
jgi:hypothetical protein